MGTQLENDKHTRRTEGPGRENESTSTADKFDEIVVALWGDIGPMNGDGPDGGGYLPHSALTVRTEGWARVIGTHIFGKKAGEQKI